MRESAIVVQSVLPCVDTKVRYTLEQKASRFVRFFPCVDPRGSVSLTRYMLPFDIPVAPTALSNQQHEDKTQLYANMRQMYVDGMSYSQIGTALVSIEIISLP